MNRDEDPSDSERTIGVSGSKTGVALGGMPTSAGESTDVDHSDKLLLGTRLGEFEIIGLVGEGGFSIVYLARDHSLERNVALKEYMPSSLAMRRGGLHVHARSERHRDTFETGLRSFVNEGKLLAQFDHPALVKVYRFWEAHGTAYMVMPFYEGTTLRDTVRAMSARPDEAWLLALLGPLTEALMAIHGVQCFHRDIAPDNVLLLLPAGKPLLLDFGAARRVIGDRTQALTVILKPGYAPVEQYAEDIAMKQGPWTDVYALAAVVYWAITGKTPPVAVGRMLTDSFVPLERCAAGRYSAGFLQAVDRALTVLPAHRTQSIEQFRRELGLDREDQAEQATTVAWVDPEATVLRSAPPRPPSSSSPQPPQARPRARTTEVDTERTVVAAPVPRGSNRRLAASAAALALGGAVVAGAWWWSGRSPHAVVAAVGPPASAAPAAASAAAPQAPAAPSTGSTMTPNESLPAAGTTEWTARAAVERLLAQRDPSFEITASIAPAGAGASKSMRRIQFRATEGGHTYVLAMPPGADRLLLLAPASLGVTRKSSDAGHIDVQAVSIEEGTWLALVISREPRDIAAAGWTLRSGVLTREAGGVSSAASTAVGVLGAPVCAASAVRCDPAFGMTEVTSMTNVTTLPTTTSSRSEGRATVPKARTNSADATAPDRAAYSGSSEGKPAAKRDAGEAAECARILQRLSLGESSTELIERMKTLRCS